MKSVMLYFGSFNPVHRGHIAVAEYVLEKGLCEEIWFVVSPKNPLKQEDILIDENDRLEMVGLAVAASACPDRMKAVDIEFELPKPSYTIDTLRVLQKLYPATVFSLLLGSDIAGQFHLWKEWETLLSDYHIYMYPRRGYKPDDGRFIMLEDAPYFDYSSTEVRQALGEGRDVSDMLAPEVYNYIKKKRLWI